MYCLISFPQLHSFLVINLSSNRALEELGFDAIVVRPGRLVGAPFTNFDLAKLLGLNHKGIIIDTRDVLARL